MATVIIVDDNPDTRKFLSVLLKRHGYQVLDTPSAEHAISLCATVQIDLVITDVLMPGMDGYELVRRLRADPAIAITPVIFFSGLFDPNDAPALASKYGVQQVIAKPSSPAEILQAVAAAVSSPPDLPSPPPPTFDREHARILSDVLLRNVDELAMVNSRLAESERQYREMFEDHPEPMWVLDAQTLAFLSVNDAAVRQYGYSRAEFLALSIFDILPRDEIRAALAVFQRSSAGQVSPPGSCRYFRKDGSVVEVETTTQSLQFGGRAAFSVRVYDVTERNRYERSLRSSEEQLRQLASRLQQVREEERARLARELHDDLGQSLTAIRMSLAWLANHPGAAPEAITARIVSTMEVADRSIDGVRRLASELRPGILDLGLQAALEWQVQEFKFHSEIQCELEFASPDIPLTQEQEVSLFRIFQETLTNVARHSGATKVTTRVALEGGKVTLAVQDNGRGIGPGEVGKRKSLGLLGMRERVQSLGGSIRIDGKPGAGTLVYVSVPLTRPPG